MRTVKITVPGSTMMFGEHAVLRGGWGFRAALDQGVTVALIPRNDDRVRLHTSLGFHEGTRHHLDDHPALAYAVAALRARLSSLTTGIDLQLMSARKPMGLGSSAAVIIGILVASTLSCQPGKALENLDHTALLREGLGVLHRVTNGVGSGADLAASLCGGVVATRKSILHDMARFPAPPLTFTLVYSGYKTPTAQVVNQVRAWATDRPERSSAVFERMIQLSEDVRGAFERRDWQTLKEAFPGYYECQKDIGVSDGHLDELHHSMECDPGFEGVKIAGAGLGDCLIGIGCFKDKPAQIQASHCLPMVISECGPREVPLEKQDILLALTGPRRDPVKTVGTASAPVNIALIKYWGKRDEQLNLPMTDSLSLTLPWGTRTRLSRSDEDQDVMTLNGVRQASDSVFSKNTGAILDWARPRPDFFFRMETTNDLPTAAGLASSASGLAALTLALEDYFGWDLSLAHRSIIARMMSGSASRSVLGGSGFVHWKKGAQEDGLDSYAEQLPDTWSGLCLGIVTLQRAPKHLSSRQGMTEALRSKNYVGWPAQVERDLSDILKALKEKNFSAFGQVVESNALAMHRTTQPENLYFLAETFDALKKVRELREKDIHVYATIDAGPNIKILFMKDDKTVKAVEGVFGSLLIWKPVFES